MKFPFNSFTSGGAEADCFNCAKQFYLDQTHNSSKAIEEVFPNLCAAAQSMLVDPMEFFTPQENDPIETLRTYLHHSCKRNPSEAYRLIESDVSQVSSISPAGNSVSAPNEQHLETSNNENLSVPVQASLPSLAAPVKTMSPSIRDQQLPLSLIGTSTETDVTASNSKALTPYSVAEFLQSRQYFQIIGEALFFYSDGYYRHLTTGNMRRLIMAECRSAVKAAGSSRIIDEVFKLIYAEPTLVHTEEERCCNLVAFRDGVLNLNTNVLMPHSPAFSIFYQLDADWNTNTAHPVFDHFLETVTGGDPYLTRRIWEMVGYSLVPDVSAKAVFVLSGAPNSGKSLLANFIRSCVPPESSVALDITSLGDRFVAANLVGKQLCLSMDIPSSPLNPKTTAVFKSITGGDAITADVKYAAHITFSCTSTFILGTNHPLLTQTDDPAFFERMVAIPFKFQIPIEKQDRNLLEKLRVERSAIIKDSLGAYQQLRRNNYRFSGDYRMNEIFNKPDNTDSLSLDQAMLNFVRNFCEPDPDGFEFTEDLLIAFQRTNPSLSLTALQFSHRLTTAFQKLGLDEVQHGCKKRRPGKSTPQANFIGIHLKHL